MTRNLSVRLVPTCAVRSEMTSLSGCIRIGKPFGRSSRQRAGPACLLRGFSSQDIHFGFSKVMLA